MSNYDIGTIANYRKRYKQGGLEGLITDDYKGGVTKLSITQENELDEHLQNNIYTSTKEIINYVRKKYSIEFSISGMNKLLHRLNFSFKKPKVVPGKVDTQKQEEFIEFYNQLKSSLLDGEKMNDHV